MLPLITEHDIKSNTIITREMNNLEFSHFQQENEQNEIRKQEIIAKQQARQQLLNRIGLTEEEVAILLNQ